MTRRRLLVLLLALALVSGGAGVGVYLLTRGPSYPDEWDPRVRDLVEVVERERDLDFDHPVHVDFLSEEDFRTEVTADEDELTEEDRKEIRETAGLMRALGFIQGDIDLFDVLNDLRGGGVIGLYDNEDKRIRLRGEKLTPAVRATLVHELTHALQDQHFDLAARYDELEEKDDSSASAGWKALVEGDANRVESAYEEDLPAKDRKALEEERKDEQSGSEKDLADVPEFLQALMGSPYAFGEALLALAVKLDGEGAVDDLFEDPPVTEEHLYDPWTLLEDAQEALEVDDPGLARGEKEFDSGTFGSPAWLFLLAERVDLKSALRATDGWGGDAYVAFRREGVSCVRVRWRGDTRRDLVEMQRELRRWVAAGPAGTASVDVAGTTLTFESCDPGKRARAGKGVSQEALQLAVGRTWLSLAVLREEGVPGTFARCFSQALVERFEPDQLLDPRFGAGDPKVERTAQALARGCL